MSAKAGAHDRPRRRAWKPRWRPPCSRAFRTSAAARAWPSPPSAAARSTTASSSRACAKARASRPRRCSGSTTSCAHRRRAPARRPSCAAHPGDRSPAAPQRRGAAAVDRAAERNFRFFDNRQKYLLFVNTCSEKEVVARRVGLELAHIHPRPPAIRLFDAGMGDGTVLTRVMREMHRRFPTMPFYIVGKEISLEDVRLSLRQDGRPLLRASGDGAGGHQHVLHRGAVADAQVGDRRDLDGVAGGRARPAPPRTNSASRSRRSTVPGQALAGAPQPEHRQSRSTSGRWCW